MNFKKLLYYIEDHCYYIYEEIERNCIFKPRYREELKLAIDLYCEDIVQCIYQYGITALWKVNDVTDMSYLFYDSKFTGDISCWNVSNVINMEHMFNHSKFDNDISYWDVGNVNDMNHMFEYSAFNDDIYLWDVSSVIYMDGMFYSSKFSGNISQWDINNVKTMEYMFSHSTINRDIISITWNINKSTNIKGMFYDNVKNKYIPKISSNGSFWDYYSQRGSCITI